MDIRGGRQEHNSNALKDYSNISSIFELPDELWQCYLTIIDESATNSDGITYTEMQDNGFDYINYFAQSSIAISNCYSYYFENKDEKLLDQTEDIIQCMMNTWERNGKFPRPEYKYRGYKYGWVSSMDAPVIMLAALMLHELTGKDEYLDFALELIPYCMLNTEEGGFNFPLNDNAIWPLEYASYESDESNNMYVLNGSLTGYIAMLASNIFLKDSTFEQYLNRVEKAYPEKEFHYENNMWSYYMLNEPKVIPIHYLIFEEKLFDAAYKLNHNEYFNNEYIFRQKLLKQALRIEFYEDEDGRISYYLLRASMPNNYQIDTYGTKIQFLDKRGKVVSENENLISGSLADDIKSFYDGLFMTGVINKKRIVKYRLLSNNGIGWYSLFEDEVLINGNVLENNKNENVKLSGVKDGEYVNNILKVVPELSEYAEADLTITFEEPIDLNSSIVCVETGIEKSVNSGLIIYDEDGKAATRYYTPLMTGKNLIVFSAHGFTEMSSLENISKIFVRFYEGEEPEEFDVTVGKISVFHNTKDLYDYVMSTEYKIPPQ